MEFRALRAKKTSFEDELPFCLSEVKSSIARDLSSRGLGNALALVRVYGSVNGAPLQYPVTLKALVTQHGPWSRSGRMNE